ncbi:MAG: hypothetical protein ABI451_00355 [Dokdonella sp.]
MRITIDALGFPDMFRSVAIDAMFATHHGLKPVRIATFQRGAVSPVSKPFAFEVDGAGLAGFRAEHAGSDADVVAIASSALLASARPTLTPGRYLLALTTASNGIDIDSIGVAADPAASVVDKTGNAPAFAWLSFSVHPLTA